MPIQPVLPLRLGNIGEEACEPGHSYGPAVRDYFLIHVVISGKGVLHNAHGSFPVKGGQAFLISPGESTVYRASRSEPWHYVWAGFMGGGVDELMAAAGMSSRHPVLELGAHADRIVEVLRTLYTEAATLKAGETAAIGGVYRLLAFLQECASGENAGVTPAEQYYRKALWLMETGVTDVQSLADRIGLSRSQLFRVFKQACGESPKTVLDRKRMKQAIRLLEETDLSVSAVAGAVGYSCASRLCDVFRQAGLDSPSTYRHKSGSGSKEPK